MVDSTPNDVIAALARRIRRDGARPLITYLDVRTGARMDLSATTTANWVAKVSWLLDDEGVSGGDAVALPVLAERPGHWLSLVWALGCWAAGARIEPEPGEAEVAVVGPQGSAVAPTTVALSLDVWGRGFAPGTLPAGTIDGAEVLGQPDAWRATGEAPADPDLAGVGPDSARRLVVAGAGYDALRALAAAILGGGSVVTVEGDPTPAELTAVAAAERVAA